jgi:hypothetical protein
MTHTTKHTPLDKATRAIPMLYAEAFAGSNNKEFVVELYEDARLLEKAAPAMYAALQIMVRAANVDEIDPLVMFASIERAKSALAQAEGHQHG